ncbi:MAG: response regulator [Patescibacteria group bacterium]|nr:response regulator [Patescibacteria group bacterium]
MEIKGASILIVDDEESIRQVMVDFFTIFGAEIFTAVNSDAALDIIKEEKVDLIISDQDMPPGPSGIELLVEVKQYYKHIVFILISAYNLKKEAEMAGADAFLQKRFSLSKLKEAVEKL